MEDRRYIISETSAKTGLEAHVLRYWEDELGLQIPRNELGHRYYTEEHIKLFNKIKELKDKGYQLKAVKSELEGKSELKIDLSDVKKAEADRNVFPEAAVAAGFDCTAVMAGSERTAGTNDAAVGALAVTSAAECPAQNGDKLEQFKAIIGGIVAESLRENNIVLQDGLAGSVSEKVIKEMDYLLRLKEESEDERFRKLDETIRNYQRSGREAAAYSEESAWKKRHKKGRFGKNRRV